MAQTFDGPTTIKRSGSEHRRAVTSLALLERARAWEWVKDPPVGEGQVGQIQHCGAVSLFFPEGRRPRSEVEPSLMVKKDRMILESINSSAISLKQVDCRSYILFPPQNPR